MQGRWQGVEARPEAIYPATSLAMFSYMIVQNVVRHWPTRAPLRPELGSGRVSGAESLQGMEPGPQGYSSQDETLPIEAQTGQS